MAVIATEHPDDAEVHAVPRRRALLGLLTAVLLAAGGGVAGHLAFDDAAEPARALRVTPAGPNPAIEAAALSYVRDLHVRRNAQVNPSATAAIARFDALYSAPHIVGLTQPRRNVVVVALRDDVVVGARRHTVYTTVTLVNTASRYQVTDATTTCDGAGDGLLLGVPVPGDDVVVVLGTRTERVVPAGSRITAPPAAGMLAWTDPRLALDGAAVLHEDDAGQRTRCEV